MNSKDKYRDVRQPFRALNILADKIGELGCGLLVFVLAFIFLAIYSKLI